MQHLHLISPSLSTTRVAAAVALSRGSGGALCAHPIVPSVEGPPIGSELTLWTALCCPRQRVDGGV